MKSFVAFLAFATAAAAATNFSQCRDILQHALDAKNPDTRKAGVVALSLAANNSPLFDQLTLMLDDKDVQVRIAAVTSLSEVKTKPAIAALRKSLQDTVPEVSFAAAKALYAAGDVEGKDALLAIVEKETKTSSGFITSQMRDAWRMMHTPGATFIYAVKQGLGFVPLPGFGEGVASLQALLSDPGISGRASAALLLSTDKDPAAIEALRDALRDKDWHVRAAAIHALAMHNSAGLKADIEPFVADDKEKEEVRLRAAAAWLRLDAIEKQHRKR